MDEWSVMFYFSAAICIVATLIFLFYGSSEKQPWNNPPIVLPAESETNVYESENSLKGKRETLIETKNLSFQQNNMNTSDNTTSDQAGTSSQSGLTPEESNQRKEKSRKIPGRPWRSDSFFDLPPEPRDPAIVIPFP